MTQILTEIKRNQHINKTKASDNYEDLSLGRNRYFRRSGLKIEKSVQHLNRIDMNKLFDQGILDVNLDVRGETNTYLVRVSFGKFLYELHNEVRLQENNFSLRVVTLALTKAFNTDDVLVRCNCPDFVYRLSYHLSMNGGIAGEMETRPSNITNPDDTKGSGCKHILAVLSNTGWLQRVARVITNYINYMQTHFESLYSSKIYPAIYEKEYDDLELNPEFVLNKADLDRDEKNTSQDLIDTTNKWDKEKDKFKSINGTDQVDLDMTPVEKKFDIDSAY